MTTHYQAIINEQKHLPKKGRTGYDFTEKCIQLFRRSCQSVAESLHSPTSAQGLHNHATFLCRDVHLPTNNQKSSLGLWGSSKSSCVISNGKYFTLREAAGKTLFESPSEPNFHQKCFLFFFAILAVFCSFKVAVLSCKAESTRLPQDRYL